MANKKAGKLVKELTYRVPAAKPTRLIATIAKKLLGELEAVDVKWKNRDYSLNLTGFLREGGDYLLKYEIVQGPGAR